MTCETCGGTGCVTAADERWGFLEVVECPECLTEGEAAAKRAWLELKIKTREDWIAGYIERLAKLREKEISSRNGAELLHYSKLQDLIRYRKQRVEEELNELRKEFDASERREDTTD